MNYFCQCGSECELNKDADLDFSIGEEDDASHEDWIQPDAEDDYFISYLSVDTEIAVCGISSIGDFCGEREGGGSVGEESEEDKHDPEQFLSFTKACAAYEDLQSIFYLSSIGKCDEQNILNLEMALFCLKRKVSTKQLSCNRLLQKKVI